MTHQVLVYKKRTALANVSKRGSNDALFPTSYEMLKVKNFLFYYFRGIVWRKLYLFFSQYNYGNTTSSSSYYTGDRSRGRRGSRLEKSLRKSTTASAASKERYYYYWWPPFLFLPAIRKSTNISEKKPQEAHFMCIFSFPLLLGGCSGGSLGLRLKWENVFF